MKIRRFEAPDMQQAIAQIKAELGPDALVVSSRPIRQGLFREGVEGNSLPYRGVHLPISVVEAGDADAKVDAKIDAKLLDGLRETMRRHYDHMLVVQVSARVHSARVPNPRLAFDRAALS